MASYDNLASVEPWSVFRSLLSDSSFANPWMVSSSDPFYLESETMTKALSASMSPTSTTTAPTATPPTINIKLTEIFNNVQLPTADTPPRGQSCLSAGSAGSGSASASDPETVPKRVSRNNIPVAPSSGKATKRKSRASKKSPTTFITADPANFRQMVQQVTGVRFPAASGGGPVPVTQILKPEPQRFGIIGSAGANSGFGRFQGCLPTLDTSAFLLDHHQVSHSGGGVASATTASGVRSGSGLGFIGPSVVGANGSGGAAGVDFDGYPSFPTLESCRF